LKHGVVGTRLNVLSYGIKIWTDLSSIFSGITRVTDRQTDRQTDGQIEFSSLDRICITCSAVKAMVLRDTADSQRGQISYMEPAFPDMVYREIRL